MAKRTARLDAVFGKPGVIVGMVIREARTLDGAPYSESMRGLRVVPFAYSRSFNALVYTARKLRAHFLDKAVK